MNRTETDLAQAIDATDSNCLKPDTQTLDQVKQIALVGDPLMRVEVAINLFGRNWAAALAVTNELNLNQ